MSREAGPSPEGRDAPGRPLPGRAISLHGPRPPQWWTGLAPPHCPGADADGTMRPLPALSLDRLDAESLRTYFENAWTLTETLFAALEGEEAFFCPPRHGLRHPLVFYYGHPAAFYVSKLRLAGLLEEPVEEGLERLFARGVDEMPGDDLVHQPDWPGVADVTAYRRTVRERVLRVIDEHRRADGVGWDHPLWSLLMAIEHERIHLETSSVLIRELPVLLVRRPERWPRPHPALESPARTRASGNRWVELSGGEVELGKPRDHPSFGWDNEYGSRAEIVPPFEATERLVSNAEFLEFVEDRGYAQPRWWTLEGWRWRSACRAFHPPFWVSDDAERPDRAGLRLLFEVVPMAWDAPAVVTCHEAEAYAAWRSATEGGPRAGLPDESEHALLHAGTREDPSIVAAGPAMAALGFNLALAWGSESPVDALPAARSGVRDALGNVWQWSRERFAPLPGFRPHPLYEDYSTPAFDGAHRRILGGSFATTGAGGSVFARNQFRPHFVQHIGFRLVRRPETWGRLRSARAAEARLAAAGGG